MRTFRPRRAAGAAVVVGALVVSGLTAIGAGAAPTETAAPVAAGAAGVPEAPTEIYHEGFENNVVGSPVALEDYTGAGGATYTADAGWLHAGGTCNGIVISSNKSDGNASPSNGIACANFSQLRGLANTLGTVNNSSDPADNHVLSAYTTNNPGVDSVEFETEDPISLPGGGARFLTFSVNAAAINCNANGGAGEPLYKFFLVDPANPGTEIATFSAPINPCGAAGSGSGQFFSNGSSLFSGSQVILRLRNGNGSGIGNDAAFDDIRLFDATPALDKTFEPAQVQTGQPARLRFTITNTTDLAAKVGWSFTDELPDGMTVASPATASTTCDNATVTATAGADSVALTGDLGANDESCTFDVNVVTGAAGSFTNATADVATVGLNPPPPAALTVTDPTPFDCLSPRIFLAQNQPTRLDYLTPGSTGLTPVSPAAPGVTYNAIALNPQDNLIYALGVAGGTNGHLLRIDGAGTVVDLGPTSPLTPLNAGTFDGAGNFYAVSSSGGPLRSIDVATLAVTSIPRTDNFGLPADLAWVDGALWGQQDGRDEFIRIATDGTTTRFPTAGVLPDTVAAGAAWTFGNGNLGLSDNNTGTIYQIEIGNPNSPNPTFTVVSSQTGPDSGNNDGTACPGAPVDLSILKAVDPPAALPGQDLTYTLTVRNNGPGNSSGFTVTDALPADLDNPATTTAGCTIDAGVLTCIGGPLPANGTFDITYTGTAPAGTGTLDNSARVVGNEEDPTPDNDTSTTRTPVVPAVLPTPTPSPAPPAARPDLALRKTAPARAQADRSITWRIQVRNRGTGPSVGATLTDRLPRQIRSARVASPAGVRCTVAKRNVRCDLGTIAPGKAVVVKITGRISPNAKGRMTNTATVSDARDANTRNDRSAATTRVRPVPAGRACSPGVLTPAPSPGVTPQVRTAGRAGC